MQTFNLAALAASEPAEVVFRILLTARRADGDETIDTLVRRDPYRAGAERFGEQTGGLLGVRPNRGRRSGCCRRRDGGPPLCRRPAESGLKAGGGRASARRDCRAGAPRALRLGQGF